MQNIMEKIQKRYDIVVVGCGAGGIGAAYALKEATAICRKKHISVLLVDENEKLGGTHINAWVNVFAATPPAPFEEAIFDSLKQEKGAVEYLQPDYTVFSNDELKNITFRNTYMEQLFLKDNRKEALVSYDVEALTEKYMSDLNCEPFELVLNTKLISVSMEGRKVNSLILNNRYNDSFEVFASVFIDATGDGILCRLAKSDYYLGEDGRQTFLKKYGFEESAAPVSPMNYLNVPTLMYKIEKGEEDLSNIDAAYSFDSLVYNNPNRYFSYVNSVHYLEEAGASVITEGKKVVYDRMVGKTMRHWKTIKAVADIHPPYKNYNLSKKRYSSAAPMLGVRETYRICCRRMLNENDLIKKISKNCGRGDNILDSIIAIGNHSVDIHGVSNLNKKILRRMPYGVSYGSIVPDNLDNVFIACRASGFTHIAAASIRLTRNIMQIGYAAGKASAYMIDQGSSKSTDVDVDKFYGSEYFDVESLFSSVYSMIDVKYKDLA